MGPKMADFWDWIVPNVAGETNAKVADARKQYTGANGRLDPNAISAETLAQYGVPSQVTEDAAPYLSTYRMGNDISKSALTPPERGMGETIGGLLQAAAIPVSFAQGNKGFGAQLFDDNIMTRDAKRKAGYEDAQRESVLKNAQNLTGNVDQIIAEQQKARSASRARKDTQSARENEADRYGLTGAERNRYILEGKYDAEFRDKTGGGAKGPSPYIQNPDGTATFRPGGPADPATVSKLSEARGRGGLNVPQNVRSDAIKVDQAYQALVPALDDYYKTVETTGGNWLPGTADRDAVSSKRRNIQLQLKELYNLGVLNGPDLDLMDTMLFDPSVTLNPWAESGGMLNGINPVSRTKASVDRLQSMLRDLRNTKTRIIGLDDIGPDGKPILGSGKLHAAGTSTTPSTAEGTSVDPAALSDLSDDDIKAQLGIE
jgi:hypothetical protein